MEPLSEGVQLALIVAGTGVATGLISPFVISWQNSRHRRAEKLADASAKALEKKEDYARQDEVAANAARAAEKVAEAARLLLASNERVAEAAKATALQSQKDRERIAQKTDGKLNVIHGLVNSAYMAAKQSELAAWVASLTVLKREQIRDPQNETLTEIKNAEKKIAELQIVITELERQAKLAEGGQLRGGYFG